MLDHHTVNVALERPQHQLILLNALLSRIYAFHSLLGAATRGALAELAHPQRSRILAKA
jgi:hypothetical protein